MLFSRSVCCAAVSATILGTAVSLPVSAAPVVPTATTAVKTHTVSHTIKFRTVGKNVVTVVTQENGRVAVAVNNEQFLIGAKATQLLINNGIVLTVGKDASIQTMTLSKGAEIIESARPSTPMETQLAAEPFKTATKAAVDTAAPIAAKYQTVNKDIITVVTQPNGKVAVAVNDGKYVSGGEATRILSANGIILAVTDDARIASQRLFDHTIQIASARPASTEENVAAVRAVADSIGNDNTTTAAVASSTSAPVLPSNVIAGSDSSASFTTENLGFLKPDQPISPR